MSSLADGLARLLAVLDRLDIPYAIGESVASTFHGIYRATNDVDLVAQITEDRVDELASQLQGEFYADPEAMRHSLSRGRPFNAIHYANAYKFDVFPLRGEEYSRTEFARRSFQQLDLRGPQPLECAVATAEDTALRKLARYRAGGESSERQLSDVQGILRIGRDKLDVAYLKRWAAYLRVDDLLERLWPELQTLREVVPLPHSLPILKSSPLPASGSGCVSNAASVPPR